MLTEDKITEIFVMADEFCKVFDAMHTALSFKNALFSRKASYFIGGCLNGKEGFRIHFSDYQLNK